MYSKVDTVQMVSGTISPNPNYPSSGRTVPPAGLHTTKSKPNFPRHRHTDLLYIPQGILPSY